MDINIFDIYADLYGNVETYPYDYYFINFIRKTKKQKPDLVHTHQTYSGVLARLCAKLAGKIKVVHTVHANHRSYNHMQNLIIGLTLPFCDRIVCNSQNTKRSFLPWQKIISWRKTRRVIYNGVNI